MNMLWWFNESSNILKAGVEFLSTWLCGYTCDFLHVYQQLNSTEASETNSLLWNFPAFPSDTGRAHPGPVVHQVVCPWGPLSCVRGIWSGYLCASPPSVAPMKGCQICDGWVTSWGLASAATSGVRGEIGSGRVKYRGPLWPHNYPDWIHLADWGE